MTSIHWYLSKTVRQAAEVRRQVKMLLNEQRDLLAADKIAKLEAAIASMDSVLKANPGKKALLEETARLEKAANNNLKPYPAAGIRENVKEILVAITTIMAFTTFFLQLTKIPTGSMQPTLYGITSENLLDDTEIRIPGFLGRMKDYWTQGIQYKYFVAPVDGEFGRFEPPRTLFPFVKKQRFEFAGQWHTIWFPGDELFSNPNGGRPRAMVRAGTVKAGEYVFATKIVAGDHLLVDRFTYNFRQPKRGEIIVFKTRGIPGIDQNQLYIKRLVALPGETVQIDSDNHLVIDGRKLTASDRHFEMVYGPSDDTSRFPYRGHVGGDSGLAPNFSNPQESFKIRPGHFMAMGDNTLNSLDSRAWGDAAQKSIIGRCWFVYWPFTDRFGWGYR